MPRPELLASAKDYTPADMTDRKGFGDLFPPAPEPQTELARYRILSPRAGVRVSPLCLGAMSIGDQWTGWMGGKLDYDESFKFLDAFYEAGGNFIDTANNYQDEQSEMIIGEWMEKRGIRDDIVLATKYTSYGHTRKEGRAKGVGVNYTGNHRKNLMITVDDSLKKLKTSYIDILYLHWWDYTTSVEEIMHALNDLVKSGNVMYLGISDTPAWIVAQANTYAKAHALEQFVVYQGQWSLGDRDMERDVIPMAQAFGMAIAPWGAMGGGKFKSPEELKKREEEGGHLRGGLQQTEAEVKISKALQEVSDELGQGHSVATIALAWVRQKTPYCFPIIGGTKLHHLQANIESLKIHLSDAQMQKLTNAVDFDYGFPYTFFGRDPHYLPGGKPNSGLLNHVGHLQLVTLPGAETS